MEGKRLVSGCKTARGPLNNLSRARAGGGLVGAGTEGRQELRPTEKERQTRRELRATLHATYKYEVCTLPEVRKMGAHVRELPTMPPPEWRAANVFPLWRTRSVRFYT